MRSAMCATSCSYLESGPLMWMMPLHLHANQKFDYDMMMIRGQLYSKLSFGEVYHWIYSRKFRFMAMCERSRKK